MTDNRLPYAYIMGHSYSGSTLISFIMNQHSEVVSIGEVSYLGYLLPDRWKSRKGMCSCGKPYYYCNYWNRVLAIIAANGVSLEGADFLNGELFGNRLDHYWKAAHWKKRWCTIHRKLGPLIRPWRHRRDARHSVFARALVEAAGKSILLDSSKGAQRLLPIMENPAYNLKIINLLRDGRGVVNSYRKRYPDWDFEQIIRLWLKSEWRQKKLLSQYSKKQVLDIRYEDFCQDPQASIVAICQFLDINSDEHLLDFFTGAEHHIIGSSVVF